MKKDPVGDNMLALSSTAWTLKYLILLGPIGFTFSLGLVLLDPIGSNLSLSLVWSDLK